jgi:hypothetical protein
MMFGISIVESINLSLFLHLLVIIYMFYFAKIIEDKANLKDKLSIRKDTKIEWQFISNKTIKTIKRKQNLHKNRMIIQLFLHL